MAGSDFTIRLQGTDKVEKAARAALPAFRADVISLAATFAEREARLAAPRDTSALARSIHSQVQPTQARIGTNLVYASVMEFGRRPGGRMPPVAALVGWARRHGMAGREFVLARAIARRGIKGRFFLQKATHSLIAHGFPVIIGQAIRAAQNRWRQAK